MNLRIPLTLILLLASLASVAGTEELAPKSAEALGLLDKAEQLYEDGHWDRAYFIYVNELAAIGDKYAMYMAGFMCLTGKGVPQDPIKASAWYRLAAERGGQEFVAARDQLLESMSEADKEASDAVFLSLRRKYSDLVLVLAYLREERETLRAQSAGSFPKASDLVGTRKMQYAKNLESRMRVRLDHITGIDIYSV